MMGWLGVCSAANEENQSHKLVNCVGALGLPTYILPLFNPTKYLNMYIILKQNYVIYLPGSICMYASLSTKQIKGENYKIEMGGIRKLLLVDQPGTQ